CPHCAVLNLAKLTYAAPCSIDRIRNTEPEKPVEPCRIVLELTDERNALERVMLHFAHFRKTARKLEENRYELTVEYDRDDETELVIRVLSFGPFLKVVEPEAFVERIRERLCRQQMYPL
ncbi:MAG: WYL domain-containing protein, partial [Clostridia bacterium]|nr:WYL domain-containing protein [Clostridia bacterium]